ncbi:DUF885 domain-containing protein [soil metagenome]
MATGAGRLVGSTQAVALNPFDISDELVDDILALSPMTKTSLGVPGADDRWDDTSPTGKQALVAVLRSHREALAAHLEHSDPDQRHAATVLVGWLDSRIAEYDSGDYLIDLNHVYCGFTKIRDIFDIMARGSQSVWSDITARLASLEEPLGGWRRVLEAGVAAGQTAARRQVESVIEQADNLAGEDSMFAGLLDEARAGGFSDEALEEAVIRARKEAARTAEWLRVHYLPHARAEDGVGEERYIRSAERFLGMKVDTDETYGWAWGEIARLQAEMVEVAGLIDADVSVDAVIELLETDPARAVGIDEFTAFVQARLDQAVLDLDGVHFDVPAPIRPIEVKLAPPGGALGAWYINPSVDWERPGSVWYSLGHKDTVPVWQEVSTAYHEGFPGHHLQVGTSMYQADHLSRAHRLLVWYSGYGEGWALYTERLMDDLGYFDKPEYRMGMLASQLFRAVRVVVDIGCHLGYPIPGHAPLHPGQPWDFDRAVDYIDMIGLQPRDVAVSEVKRYLGWPGQAISYKVGEREIVDMRWSLERRDPGFDLKDFHRRILEGGELRLDYLRTRMLA